jgi:hypothetical protein
MSNAFIRDASSGKILSNGAVTFVRVPQRGEFIASRQRMFAVVRVIHDWDNNGVPAALVDVTPADNVAGHGSKAQPF